MPKGSTAKLGGSKATKQIIPDRKAVTTDDMDATLTLEARRKEFLLRFRDVDESEVQDGLRFWTVLYASYWTFLHAITFALPRLLSDRERENLHKFFLGIADHTLGCEGCREHWVDAMAKVSEDTFSSGPAVAELLYKIHCDIRQRQYDKYCEDHAQQEVEYAKLVQERAEKLKTVKDGEELSELPPPPGPLSTFRPIPFTVVQRMHTEVAPDTVAEVADAAAYFNQVPRSYAAWLKQQYQLDVQDIVNDILTDSVDMKLYIQKIMLPLEHIKGRPGFNPLRERGSLITVARMDTLSVESSLDDRFDMPSVRHI